MASKQLGKLRQWAGEVISSREKTVLSDEFQELEKDIELRRVGAERMYMASEAYHHTLNKKKENLALEDPEKLLAIDTLGIVMITHGEEFGEDSEYGSSLVNFGRAHCKVATLQEAFAVTFHDTFLASIEKFSDEIKEYEHIRKKLESRRLSLDAAISKLDKIKNSKKDKGKERKDAEEEMERAQARYEETAEDLRAHMHAIQENEIDQMRELTAFLDLEMNFVEQYLAVLKEVRAEWPITSPVRSAPGRRDAPSRSTSIKSKVVPPSTPKRSNSTRPSAPPSPDSDEDDDDDARYATPRSRRSSMHQRSESRSSKIGANGNTSRPSSRASRKRADSSGVANGGEERSRRMSVAGWMGSISGRGKKSKDKDQFATLDDDDDRSPRPSAEESESNPASGPSLLTRKSLTNLSRKSPVPSPQIPSRILKPPSMQGKKVVRALYDFSGSADELSFNAGDEIVVVNEVLDGWWMGELNGRQGLFPTPYMEVVVPSKPSLPTRSDTGGFKTKSNGKTKGKGSRPSSRASRATEEDSDSDGPGYDTSDQEAHEALGSQPLSPSHSPFFGGNVSSERNPETASFTSSVVDDESDSLVPSAAARSRQESSTTAARSLLSSLAPSNMPSVRRSSTTELLSSSTSNVSLLSSSKKAPPPPPPRRQTITQGSTPPVPARKPMPSRSQSSSGSLGQLASFTPGSSVSSHGTSPFDSASELTNTETCTEFKQNPFKPKGMCNNCFQYH